MEHPEWFVQSDYSPFPGYEFTGVDLSEDDRVTIQIEDGYWRHSDAAVVFKRTDRWTGDVKYIYHGNDGTSMPWNDTAQLNFLIADVREAVIQMILHVARKFPIIRFDAAMTLAKKHFQRLWFPQPGDGGAIPSRAGHGMTREEFDKIMSKEFWREVVDRVARELPDTLLLAEAFWLMEGYFVRTLGMHRVYNSAFMNMLHTEDNASYRTTIKNVLEFSPEVLKRFVNFMNNPDERTAVDQFGRGDKYYGVAVLMVTMPGLPMFGHGQIEGFSEKYGMEYRRSYVDEHVDEDMVHRHEVHIFPLMRRRHIFSGAANFALYDFTTPDGWVDENVFAYSNRAGGEGAIVIYNNAYSTTRGSIHTSTAINVADGDEKKLVRRTLAETLGLNSDHNSLYTFKDFRSGLEYIRAGRQLAEQGLFVELHAYQYYAFLDFRHIHDPDGKWRELERRLRGAGVPSLHEAYRELEVEPILGPYRELMNPVTLRRLLTEGSPAHDMVRTGVRKFYQAVGQSIDAGEASDAMTRRFMAGLELLGSSQPASSPRPEPPKPTDEEVTREKTVVSGLDHVTFAWLTLETLGQVGADQKSGPPSNLAVSRVNQWLLLMAVREAFEGWLSDGDLAYWDSRLVLILLTHPEVLEPAADSTLGASVSQALQEPSVREYLQINSHNDILWLNKERLERMMAGYRAVACFSTQTGESSSKDQVPLAERNSMLVIEAGKQADYQVDKMILALNRSAAGRKSRR